MGCLEWKERSVKFTENSKLFECLYVIMLRYDDELVFYPFNIN